MVLRFQTGKYLHEKSDQEAVKDEGMVPIYLDE